MNLTGVFITYKTDDTKSKWCHRFFIYLNLSDSYKILVILKFNKNNLTFRCFTLFFDKFAFIFNKLETMVHLNKFKVGLVV